MMDKVDNEIITVEVIHIILQELVTKKNIVIIKMIKDIKDKILIKNMIIIKIKEITIKIRKIIIRIGKIIIKIREIIIKIREKTNLINFQTIVIPKEIKINEIKENLMKINDI